MSEDVTIQITAKMSQRWAPHFLGMLKTMEQLGSIGASRLIAFMSDGDGDFYPRFEWDSDIAPAKHEEQLLNMIPAYFFDAG